MANGNTNGTDSTDSKSNGNDNSNSDHAKVLPACQRCRLRKVKCDRRAPKCSSCLKSKLTCIIVDPITSLQYSRDEIRQLEDREKELREKIGAAEARRLSDTAAHTAAAVLDGISTDNMPSSASPTGSSAFVGESSGHNLLRVILSDQRWRSCEPQLLRQLAERPGVPEMAIKPNPQPSVEEASSLMDTYFSRFHINHTFLARRHVTDIFNRVYRYQPGSQERPSSQDYFRLFMVFAISGVSRFRSGASGEHPFGYYLTAQTYLGNIPLVGCLDSIQNLLLIARFSMYYQIGESPPICPSRWIEILRNKGTSSWDLSRFCLRQCVEAGLHLSPRKPESPLHEQHQRRVFWDCYIFDRYSSSVLGRPFAIADRDITIELPVDASDETIAASEPTLLSDVILTNDKVPTELSVFIFVIKLRRILSRVVMELYNGRATSSVSGETTPSLHLSSGDVYVKLYKFLNELDAWRRTAPVFQNPQTLYERPEWYDWLMIKDKLILVRLAMHLAPKRNGQPPHDLLAMSLELATRTITLYDEMAQARWITWTRTYFQIIFTAGLSVFYCISMYAQRQGGQPGPSLEALEPTLSLCNEILQAFRREMPDAGRFAIVFEILKNNFLRERNQAELTDVSSHDAAHRYTIYSRNDHEYSQNTRSNLSAVENSGFSATLAPEMGLDMLAAPLMGFETRGMDDVQSETLAWPELTDEFMEMLESGIGEYAWGALDGNTFNWGDPQYNSFQG